MFKTLRIICCIISVAIVAACIFIFTYAGMLWGFISVLGALAFFGLTVLFKNLQEAQEEKAHPSEPKGDFITGAVHNDKNKGDNI